MKGTIMEEQKKSENNGGATRSKQRPPRRHGYFIEPPSENKEQASTPAASAPQGNKANTGDRQKNAQKHKNDGKQNRNQDHGTDNTRNANPKATNSDAGEQKKRDGAQAHDGNAKKNKNSHQRNKHKKGSPATTSSEQNTQPVVQPSAKQPAQKEQAPAQAPKKKFPGDRIKSTDARTAIPHSADDYEEYTLTVDDDTDNATAGAVAEEDIPKTEVVGIRFKSTGKVYYFDPKGKSFKKGMSAIVDTARGQEFGEVAMSNSFVRSSDIVPPLRPVIRATTTADVEHHKANKAKEEEAFRICNEKILAHGLDMKLIDAQYTFDNSKLLFYFTSSDRVDFRNLVKDLAGVFRTRIELRQIGIRDEAKLMGGLGMCGRPLCCTLFLSDFDQVSIKMAKEQNLSLNSAKISGICGRLMCCLRYEHEAYEYEIKRTPPVDSLVRTENGDGVVTEINPLARTVKVRLLASPEVPPKVYKRDEVTMLRKKQSGSNDDKASQ